MQLLTGRYETAIPAVHQAETRSISCVNDPNRWINFKSVPALIMSASISPVRSVIKNSFPGNNEIISSLDGDLPHGNIQFRWR